MARQRDRGRILTEAGKEKIKQAIRAWEFEHERRCTQEQLKELTGLDPSTSSKILNAKGGADLSKIEDFFQAFGLKLEEADLRSTQTISAPEPNPNFVGREDAIADLNALVRRGAKLIVIQARGGVGKTTLAWEYLRTQGFDLVLELWMAKETQNIASVEGVIEEWLRRYFDEEPGREFGVTLERLRQKLRDPSQKIGILIDNLEPALDQSGKFIEAHRRYVELMRVLSDRAAQSVSLITSRERLQEADFGIEHYLLRSLDQQAWQQFFEHHGIHQDEFALAELHRAYGGNAKAMEILRSVVQADFDGNLAAYWQANQSDLFIERALEDLVAQQFDRLQQHDSDAYNLLCRMGCYRFQDVPTVPLEGLLCLLWDAPEGKRRRVVRSLQERSLVEIQSNQYSLHPVIRAEAIERLTKIEDWEITNNNAAEFWSHSIEHIETVTDALAAFEAYHHYMSIFNFEEAGRVILRRRPSKWHDFDKGERLDGGFHRLGLVQQMHIATIKVVESINSSSEALLYNLCRGLSRSFRLMGDFCESVEYSKKSIYLAKKAREKCDDVDSMRDCIWSEAYSLINLGICKIELGDFEEAIKYFEEALWLNADYMEPVINFYLALLYSSLDTSDTALQFLEKSYQEIPVFRLNTWARGDRLVSLGLAYKNIGRIDKSSELYNRALLYAQDSKDNRIKAIALYGLAALDREVGQFVEALQKNLGAIEILTQIGSRYNLAEAYYQCGLTYQVMKETEKSCTNFQEALRLFSIMKAPKQVERVRRSMHDENSNAK